MSLFNSSVGCVIPVHNALTHVNNLIADLEKSEAKNLPQIFIDDASTESVREPIISYMKRNPKVQLITNETQQLFTRTVNRGIRAHATSVKWFAIINTDCRLAPGWLNRLIITMQKDPEIAVVGYPDGRPTEDGDQEAIYPTVEGSPDYISGHCLLIPRWAFESIGLFPEAKKLEDGVLDSAHIGSERLWCWEAARRGYKMFYANSPLCIHDSGGPSWKREIGWLVSFPRENLWPAARDASW